MTVFAHHSMATLTASLPSHADDFDGARVGECGDDGIQCTEMGEGLINASLFQVNAKDNAECGVKMEQWPIEEEGSNELAGTLLHKRLGQ